MELGGLPTSPSWPPWLGWAADTPSDLAPVPCLSHRRSCSPLRRQRPCPSLEARMSSGCGEFARVTVS